MQISTILLAFAALGIAIILYLRLSAALFWLIFLRRRLAVTSLLLISAILLTIYLVAHHAGVPGPAGPYSELVLFLAALIPLTIMLLNLLAYALTRVAGLRLTGSTPLRVPFNLSGPFDWIFRQTKAEQDFDYEPPAVEPLIGD